MKNKHLIISAFVFYFSVFNMFAQEEMSAGEQEIFKEKVRETAISTQSITSDFIQEKHISVLDNDVTAEGKLVFKAPGLVKWEYITPYQSTAVFKNDKLYVNEEGKKSEVDLGKNKLFRSLNSLIVSSIKGDMFDESQFELSYFKTESGYLVRFIPKEKKIKKYIASFELKFSEDNAEVTEVKLIEPNEDYTAIIFKNKRLNAPVSNSVFEN